MHAFLMFSSFQMPLQMQLATQLVIIFILCFLLRAVFYALSPAARTTSQYQGSMQNDPVSYAEIAEQKILARPTLVNPEIEDLNKMQSQSLLGCGSGLPPSLGLHSFPQLFPGLGHGLSISHEWVERGQSPDVDIAPGHPLHLSLTAMGI